MSIDHKSARLARVIYRQSLRLLPWRFYAEYAEQMALDFDDIIQDTARQGRPFLLATTIVRAFADVFRCAVREHFAVLRGKVDAAAITPRVKAAIAVASSHEHQHRGVSTDGSLLIGLAAEQHGLAGQVLRELGIHASRLRASFGEPERSRERNTIGDEPEDLWAPVSFILQLTNAAECARTFGHNFIGTEHVALSLLSDTDGDAARLIKGLGIDPILVRAALAERTSKL